MAGKSQTKTSAITRTADRWNPEARTLELDASGYVRATALVDLAEHAAQAILPRTGTVTDVKTLLFLPTRENRLSAHARLRHQCDETALVEVDIRQESGKTACLIALTFALLDMSSKQPLEQTDELVQRVRIARVPLRERRADAVVAAATEVIGRKGFASATMRDIAKAAGMHVPTLYDYFPSKEALLVAIYRREMEIALERNLRDVDPKASATDQLKQLLTNQAHHAFDNRHSVALLNREFRHLSQSARLEMTALYRELLAPYEKILAKGMSSGEFRSVDPFLAANIFETAADLQALRPFFFQGKPLNDQMQNLICILIDGLTKED